MKGFSVLFSLGLWGFTTESRKSALRRIKVDATKKFELAGKVNSCPNYYVIFVILRENCNIVDGLQSSP